MTGLRHSGDTVVNSFLSIFTLLHMMIGPTSRTLQSGPVFFVRLCVRSPKGRTFSFHIESYTFKQHHKNSWFNKILLTISASLVNVHQVQVVTVKWHTKKSTVANVYLCTSDSVKEAAVLVISVSHYSKPKRHCQVHPGRHSVQCFQVTFTSPAV